MSLREARDRFGGEAVAVIPETFAASTSDGRCRRGTKKMRTSARMRFGAAELRLEEEVWRVPISARLHVARDEQGHEPERG